LTGNKYYAVREAKTVSIPYGYTEVERIRNHNKTSEIICQNSNCLPVGITYDHYILREQYEQYTPLQKQEIMLQSAIVEHVPDSEDIISDEPQLVSQLVQSEITDTDSVVYKNGSLRVNKDNGTITLTCEGIPCAETYLRIVDLDLTKGNSSRRWRLKVSSDQGTTGKAGFYADYAVYSNMQHTQMINLGYSEDGVSQITITFPHKGVFKLGGLEVYCQPMSLYDGQISRFGRETLKNIVTTGNSLEGTISLSKNKLLCVSIPYLDEWVAYVDDQPAELLHINTAFMGVELSAGDHTVKFVYHMKGLKAGAILSGMGALCLIGLIIYSNKRKRSGILT